MRGYSFYCALVVFVSTAISIRSIADADVLAGPIISPINGHAYYLLTQNTWTGSEAEAITMGGDLTTIRNSAENTWVFDTFSVAGGSGWALWIGYSRTTIGGDFGWSSKESVGYTNWAPGEPNFPDELYVLMLPTLNNNPVAGEWNNDYDRTTSTYTGNGFTIPTFVINGVVEVLPEPSSAFLISFGIVISSIAMGRKSQRQLSVRLRG